MQKIVNHKLKNGMQVFFVVDKRYTSSTIQMSFPMGWRQDPLDKIGLGHLFEHLVGKRTNRFSNKGQFSYELNKLGIQSNATTTPNFTYYFHNQSNLQILSSLELMLEAIYNSKFEKDDLEKEKSVVLTEARQHKDNDVATCWHNAAKNLYKETSLSRFFFGDEDTLGRIDLETFEEFYRTYQNPKNAVLWVVANNVDIQRKVLKVLNDFFRQYTRATNVKITTHLESFENIIQISNLKKENKNQTSICIAYRTETLEPKELVVFNFLSKILVQGLTGKLMRKFRDELGLLYNLGFHNLNQADTSMIYFQTSCSKEKKEDLINGLLSEINNLSNTITKSDLADNLNIGLFETESLISPYWDVYYLNRLYFSTGALMTTDEIIKILKTTKVKDLVNFVKKHFKESKQTVFILE